MYWGKALWEGVSISTMEATAAGVPVVTADVGGQREAVSARDTLLATDAGDGEWADAVLRAASLEAAADSKPFLVS